MEHQLPVLRAQSLDQLDRGVSGKYPFDHVAPHRPQPLATRESLAIITQPGFLYGALMTKRTAPSRIPMPAEADFPRRNNKGKRRCDKPKPRVRDRRSFCSAKTGKGTGWCKISGASAAEKRSALRCSRTETGRKACL